MSESDTPLTDYATHGFVPGSRVEQNRDAWGIQCVDADFARRLERERAELIEVVRGFMSVAKAGRMKAWRDAEALLARLGKE